MRAQRGVQQLATGWRVRGSNPNGGEIFLTRPNRHWVPPCTMDTGSISRGYGLEGPGIESQWRRDFSYPSKPALGPTLYNGYRVYFPGVKRKERGVYHPPNLTSRFKKEWKYTTTLPLGVHGQIYGKL